MVGFLDVFAKIQLEETKIDTNELLIWSVECEYEFAPQIILSWENLMREVKAYMYCIQAYFSVLSKM